MPIQYVTETVVIDGQPLEIERKVPVCRCGSEDVEERFSLGTTAGWWCDPCWETSGYRKEGPSGFDPLDAGEVLR